MANCLLEVTCYRRARAATIPDEWSTAVNEETWETIEERYRRSPETKATAVAAAEFDQAMSVFGTRIDPDYREYVLRYGGGLVGPNPIYGLRRAEWMGAIGGNGTAPDITRWFRDKCWPGTQNWLVFSIDQGGNPIGFATDGTV